MILFMILLIMTILLFMIAIGAISIGGTLLTIIGSEIIIAAFILWFVFFRK